MSQDARHVRFAYELPVCQYQKIERNARELFRNLDNSALRGLHADLAIQLIALEAEQLRRKNEYDKIVKEIKSGDPKCTP